MSICILDSQTLGLMTFYLGQRAIYRLWMTGDSLLQSKMRNGGVNNQVLDCWKEYRVWSWPRLFSNFQRLKALEVRVSPDADRIDPISTLGCLPKSLTSLKSTGPICISETLDFARHLPALRQLQACLSSSVVTSDALRLPEMLEDLTLDCQVFEFVEGFVFPPALTRLAHRTNQFSTMTVNAFNGISFLVDLRLRGTSIPTIGIPSSLTRLSLQTNLESYHGELVPPKEWHLLPRSLTDLSIDYYTTDSIATRKDVESLPASLTFLFLCNCAFKGPDFIGSFPVNLQHLSLFGGCLFKAAECNNNWPSLLPPHLLSFQAEIDNILAEKMLILPSSLTGLNLILRRNGQTSNRRINAKILWQHLPHLRHLSLHNIDLYNGPPASLTSLCLVHPESTNMQEDNNTTGQDENALRNLRALSYTFKFWEIPQWRYFDKLESLRVFYSPSDATAEEDSEIEREEIAERLEDLFTSLPANLTAFWLDYYTGHSLLTVDRAKKYLSPITTLRTLYLNLSQPPSSEILEFLPKDLTALSISLSSIRTPDLRFLPNTLKVLCLTGASIYQSRSSRLYEIDETFIDSLPAGLEILAVDDVISSEASAAANCRDLKLMGEWTLNAGDVFPGQEYDYDEHDDWQDVQEDLVRTWLANAKKLEV